MGAGSPFSQIMDRWNDLPRSRQLALAGILAGTLVVLYFVFMSSSSPNLVVAFTGLQSDDSANIADQLTKDGVPYQIGGGGSSISIPAGKVAEERIKLAQVGLPKGGGVGLEIMDNQGFGTTDFVQQVNYQRGLEGELQRSINTLDGVQSSRVSIVLPQESNFTSDQAPTTASVLLQLRPGTNLDSDQVKGITNLVSNSIQGLKPAGVTIIDQTGHVLFDGSTMDDVFATGTSSTQMAQQRQYETSLQDDVQNTLAKVVGPGRSAVTVRATLDFDSVQSTADSFGTTPQVRSSTTSTETYNGSGIQTGNPAGTAANGGTGATAAANAGGNSTYNNTTTTTNNELDKTTTNTIKAPGSVKKLSVSVVLDDSVTPAQEAALTSTVAAAVGLDQTRGDQLSVTRLPFDSSVKDSLTAAAPGSGLGQYLSYLKLLLPLLAVVLGFVLVMLLLRALSRRQLALPMPQMLQALPSGGAQAIAAPVNYGSLEPAGDPQEDRVLKLAEGNPRAVADVVQTWMREEEQ